jgi:hypothetical protein
MSSGARPWSRTGPRLPSRTAGGADVFISYGSDDVALAREVRRHLEIGGYTCWMAPDDVAGPLSWAEQIVDSIASCKVMLVLISSVANRSTHVSKEVDLALEHGKAVLPVRVEDVAPSGALQYLLALAQWIDAFPGGLGPHAEEVRRRVAAIVEAQTPREGEPRGDGAPGPGPGPAASPFEPAVAAAPVPSEPSRRRTMLLGIGGILATVIVIIGTVWVTNREEETGPASYGDDVGLDQLWDGCLDGDMGACDGLLGGAPGGSEYAEFGSTCGYRLDPGGECQARFVVWTYGDDPGLDDLWDRCNGEDFDACIELFEISPIGSEYETWGGSCGGRVEGLAGCAALYPATDADLVDLAGRCEEGWLEACDELFLLAPMGSELEELGRTCAYRKDAPPCAFTFGDSPRLDELWAACAEGDMGACDELWYSSAGESEYEAFAGTCGYRTDGDSPGACSGG